MSAPWFARLGSAPDFMARNPERIASAAGLLITHVKDVRPLAARLPNAPSFPLTFPHALVFIDMKSREPVLIVTLERSIGDTPFLCVFRRDGTRINLGDGSSVLSDREFLRMAFSLANRELDLELSESTVAWH
jgi:hypothetical protein